MLESAFLNRTAPAAMELSELFIREESFCTLCLRQPGAARLKRCTLEQMHIYTSMLEVAASSPYLCGWCAAPLRSIARLRRRAQLAQTWLRTYYTSDELPQDQQSQLLTELQHLHKSNLKCEIASPMTLAESTTSPTLADGLSSVDLAGEFHVIRTQLDGPAHKGVIDKENLITILQTEMDLKVEVDPLLTELLTTEGSATRTNQSDATDRIQNIVPGTTHLSAQTSDVQTITLNAESSSNKTPNHINMWPHMVPRGRPIAPVLVISGIRQAPKPQRMKTRIINQITYKRRAQKRCLPPEKLERSYPEGWDASLCTLAPRLERELAQRVCALDEITAENVKMLAYDFAELRGVRHNFDATLGLAGDAWLTSFLKRHSIRLSAGSGAAGHETSTSCSYDSEGEGV